MPELPGPRTIVHVAQVEISRESGMGRVAWHWRQELEARGYRFIHVGPAAVGRPVHPALFPFAAYLRYARLRIAPAAILVHEPAGMPFLATRCPVLVFSHGLERRGWQAAREWSARPELAIRARSRLLFPLWRLRPAEVALTRASAVLVLNTDDQAFVRSRYHRRAEDVFLFRNGVYTQAETRRPSGGDPATVLFVGSWIARKGVTTLVEAAELLSQRGITPRFVLAGTGRGAAEVLADWPASLRPAVEVLPRFALADEAALYAGADVFLLPSFFEGQPLALLQAMAAGCCCVASDVAGTRDLIAHGRTGLLHPPGDSGRLADCLASCLGSAVLRQELGRNARAATSGRDWETVAREVADFVERTIGRRHRGGPAARSVEP